MTSRNTSNGRKKNASVKLYRNSSDLLICGWLAKSWTCPGWESRSPSAAHREMHLEKGTQLGRLLLQLKFMSIPRLDTQQFVLFSLKYSSRKIVVSETDEGVTPLKSRYRFSACNCHQGQAWGRVFFLPDKSSSLCFLCPCFTMQVVASSWVLLQCFKVFQLNQGTYF